MARRRMQLDELIARDSRAMGLRAPRLDRSALATEPQQFIDYCREAGLRGSRPLPRKLADVDDPTGEPSRTLGTSAALMKELEVPVGSRVDRWGSCWDTLDAPAFRFIGLRAIAARLGITPTTLHEHRRSADFPADCIRRIGWLHVTDIDHIEDLDEWIRSRRVGNNKNHIRKRGPAGRAVHSSRT